MRPNWRDIFESPLIVAILDRGGRLGPPTREEDTRLILAAQAGCTASREELVVRHSPFVVMEVKKMGGYGMEYPDLFQEGMLGLDRAIDKFDPAFDNRFISYAVWWIKQAMLYAVHNTVSTIRVPVSRHKDVAKIKRLVNSGRTVTARDVQRICKTRLDVSQSILDASFRTISLNDPMWIALAESDEIGAQLHGPYNDDFADADEARWAVRMIMDDAGLG
ncbi:MAG: sigma-70 family RNA polymerase sigma factor, partial [Armatimonadetes bacterium]|nr:sigma-70 family RNA polymerase sigma factor [Armatimonadota bacterium]